MSELDRLRSGCSRSSAWMERQPRSRSRTRRCTGIQTVSGPCRRGQRSDKAVRRERKREVKQRKEQTGRKTGAKQERYLYSPLRDLLRQGAEHGAPLKPVPVTVPYEKIPKGGADLTLVDRSRRSFCWRVESYFAGLRLEAGMRTWSSLYFGQAWFSANWGYGGVEVLRSRSSSGLLRSARARPEQMYDSSQQPPSPLERSGSSPSGWRWPDDDLRVPAGDAAIALSSTPA